VSHSDHLRPPECFPEKIIGAGDGEQWPLENLHPAEVRHDIFWTGQNKVIELMRDRRKKGLVVGHTSSIPLFLAHSCLARTQDT